MASGIGGAGGGGRFPLPPENNGKAPVRKRVHFEDQADISGNQEDPTVQSTAEAFQKLLSDGASSNQAESTKPHVVSKDLGARPKERKAAKESGDVWSDISAQAAKAAAQWQKSRGQKQEESGSEQQSAFGTRQTSPHKPATPLQGPSEPIPSILTPPQRPLPAIPQQPSGSSLPNIKQPSQSNVGSSAALSRGRAEADSPVERSVRPVLFSRIQLGLMECELEHVMNMEESFRVVEDSAKSKDDIKWCRDQAKKYAKARGQLERKVNQMKIHVSESEDDLDDLITSSRPVLGTDKTDMSSVSSQELASSLATGSQALDDLEDLQSAFQQLSDSFQGAKLQFATMNPSYETRPDSHYQRPANIPHYQTPSSPRLRPSSLEEASGTDLTESQSDYLEPDNSYRASSHGYVEPDDIRSTSNETRGVTPSQSKIRRVFASLIKSLRSGLALLCARIQAGYLAFREFIRRHCRSVEIDEDSDEDAYQILGYRDSDEYSTMQARFREFLSSAYGEDIHNQSFRIPRAQLASDIADVENVAQSLRRNRLEEGSNILGGDLRTDRQSEEQRENPQISSTYALLGFPSGPTQDLDNQGASGGSVRPPRAQTVYAEIHTPPSTPSVGKSARDVLHGTDSLWVDLMTASLPGHANANQYYALVQELERVLQQLKKVVHVEERS